MAGVPIPPTVVIIDDDRSIVSVVHDVLEDDDIASLSCLDSTVAYQVVREHQPKVVILDVQMPKVDGIQVFRQLRADPATVEIPVIFLTANLHLINAQLPTYPAMRATVLAKPFNIVTLLTLVRQYLPSV
jgi:putative two-component system response regulator